MHWPVPSDPIVGVAGFVLAGLSVMSLWVVMILIYASRFVKVGPNQALIVSGQKRPGRDGPVGYRIVIGGGTFIWPVLERFDILRLEPMTLDLTLTGPRASDGRPVRLVGEAVVRIGRAEADIRRAAERYLSMPPAELAEHLKRFVAEAVRQVASAMTCERICEKRDAFNRAVIEQASGRLAESGAVIDHFALIEAGELAAPPTVSADGGVVAGEAGRAGRG